MILPSTFLLFLCMDIVSTFRAPSLLLHSRYTTTTTTTQELLQLSMVPRFNGEKWIAQTDEDLPTAGYGVGRTFLLRGPKPVITRIFQAEDYEQAVLKFMAEDKCNRTMAQGNMDYYLQNQQDWMFSRMEEQRRGIKYDYTAIDAQGIVLVLVWSAIVTAVVGRAVYSLVNGVDFYAFGPFGGSM